MNDITVPYVTASINEEDVYADHAERGIEVYVHDPYMRSYTETILSEST